MEPESTMPVLDRITGQPDAMGGKACIRGLRVTVGNTRRKRVAVFGHPLVYTESADRILEHAVAAHDRMPEYWLSRMPPAQHGQRHCQFTTTLAGTRADATRGVTGG
jgi:hypothetical protein